MVKMGRWGGRRNCDVLLDSADDDADDDDDGSWRLRYNKGGEATRSRAMTT